MRKSYLYLKSVEFKDKFNKFIQHKKKVKALEHLSTVGQFKHINYLGLIKDCLDEGFLEEKEEEFLEWMLKKYEINYLEWCHRTNWLKQQMAELAKKTQKVQPQMYFDFNKHQKKQMPEVPVEVLMQQQRMAISRRY